MDVVPIVGFSQRIFIKIVKIRALYYARVFEVRIICSYNTSMKKTINSKHGKIISQRLVEIRNKAGLTQRALAKKLNREPSLVAHYELGQRRIDLAEF